VSHGHGELLLHVEVDELDDELLMLRVDKASSSASAASALRVTLSLPTIALEAGNVLGIQLPVTTSQLCPLLLNGRLHLLEDRCELHE
jgi:hypothetical protein